MLNLVRKIIIPNANFNTSAILCKKNIVEKFYNNNGSWLNYNKVIYPPQKPEEPRRPAEFFHERRNIKYSKDKLWYQAKMIRGMSFDEALKQLAFLPYYGAKVIQEVLQEAQELAVKQHHVEYKSNLWIAESFSTKGLTIKGIRRQARARHSIVHYNYCHYFVRLMEGPPPTHYYPPLVDGFDQVKEYMEAFRNRQIRYGL